MDVNLDVFLAYDSVIKQIKYKNRDQILISDDFIYRCHVN